MAPPTDDLPTDEIERRAREALRTVQDPDLGLDVVRLGLVAGIASDGDRLRVALRPTSPLCPAADRFREEATAALREHLPGHRVEVTIVGTEAGQPAPNPLPVAAVAATALLLGLGAGLQRMGLHLPLPAVDHGTAMAAGFFGTLVALERAVALGDRVAWAAAVLLAGGGAMLLLGVPAAALVSALGAGLLAARLLRAWAATRSVEAWAGAIGAAALGAGCAVVGTGGAAWQAAALWIAFLVATVAGERSVLALELPGAGRYLGAALLPLVTGAALVPLGAGAAPLPAAAGWRLVGLGLLLVAVFLGRHDPAGIRGRGAVRYAGLAIRLAIGWLAVAGTLALLLAVPPAGPVHDAVLHAAFVGFALSMVFAHGPTVLPRLSGLDARWRPHLHLPLALLHGGLALRVAADLLAPLSPLRPWGGAASALAVILYATLLVAPALWRARAG